MTLSTGRYTSLVLLIGVSIFLSACGSIDNAKSVAISTQPNPQNEIVKSPIDNRQYASIVLDNQLEIILVSDPSVEKSAVSLSVAVGSLQEPKEFGGLAHYLEHMVLLGSKSFPEIGGYNDFVSRNGGIQNANTQLNQTKFMLAVNNDAFDEALSRFSSLFYEALLDEKYAAKERQSVHSEWVMKASNDWVILEQLNGITLNSVHPISQFSWGNLGSLADKGDKKLQTALVDMYNTYYSANLMKGAIISNLPIADMKKLAKQHFGKIPNKNTPSKKMTVAVAKPEDLKKVIHYIPQTEMKQIRINFVVDNNAEQFAVKPNGYVNYLLENEMPGTLASVLRETGLSEAVYSRYDSNQYGNAGSFSLYIDLTESGVQNRDKVMGAVLKYLALLREKGVNPRYFKEIKQSLSNSFRFKEKINDYTYAMQIAEKLQYVPTEYVLSSAYEYQRFNPEVIQAVLDQLTLDNARIFYIDKEQPGETQMKNFPSQYSVSDITPSLQLKWQKLSADFRLNLPSLNNLMPENFDLISPVHIEMPKQLKTRQGHTIHLGHSALFKQPKGIVIVDLNSGLTNFSAKNKVLAELFGNALQQQLLKLQTEAFTAGMGLNINLSNGLVLTLSGFTDKQDELLVAVLKKVLGFAIKNNDLDNLKVSLRSIIADRKRQDVSVQLWHTLEKLLSLDEYSDAALLDEIDGITPKLMKQFSDQLLKQANLRIFAFGNYSESDVKRLAGIALGQVSSGYDVSNIYQTRIMEPKVGEIYNWQQDIDLNDIGLIDAYLVPNNEVDLGAARILSQLIRPALLKQLRTEEQLAYNVNFGGETLENQMLLAFEIQSSIKGLADVQKRIDRFRDKFKQQLVQVTPEVFANIKKGILISLSQPAKNLSQQMNHYVEDWGYQRWDFNSRQRLISTVEKITLADVISLYDRIEAGKEFGRVMIQMRGTKFADIDFVEPAGAIKVTDIDSFHR